MRPSLSIWNIILRVLISNGFTFTLICRVSQEISEGTLEGCSNKSTSSTPVTAKKVDISNSDANPWNSKQRSTHSLESYARLTTSAITFRAEVEKNGNSRGNCPGCVESCTGINGTLNSYAFRIVSALFQSPAWGRIA